MAACAAAPDISAQQSIVTTQPDSAQHQAKKAETDEGFGLVPGRFMIFLGAYLPNVSTVGKLSGQTHRGEDINFEHRLGLTPNTTTFDAGATWRISKHNFLAFDYFSFDRSASKTLSDSLIWGDNVYHAGATLNFDNHVTYYGLAYRYYIWREKNWELGPGLGIDALDISTTLGIQGSASNGSGSFVGDSAVKKASLLAPLPMLGLYGDWEFVPRLLLRGSLEYVYINDISGVGGHVTDDGIGVEWYPLRNFGVGANYHYVGLGLTRTFSNSDKLSLNYTIQGTALYLIATF